jgi:hypothetical protein
LPEALAHFRNPKTVTLWLYPRGREAPVELDPVSELSNIVFLDFEASSLRKHGYPIEVGWVSANGEEEQHLIRPAPSWTDWDGKAEAIHGLSRDRLMAEGTPHDEVAQRMVSVLTGRALYATAPSWDGKWLSKLLRTAGLPRHALRLQDTEQAHRRAILDILRTAQIPAESHKTILQDILAQSQLKDDELGPAAHRALADAQREQRLWHDVRRRALKIAGEPKNSAFPAAQADG